MDKMMKLKLTDDALEQVVGGTGDDTAVGDGFTKKRMVCPNKSCESRKPGSPAFEDGKAWFRLYGGGRAYCEVCGKETNL